MRTLRLTVIVAALGILATGCPPVTGPDLIVESFVVTGTPTVVGSTVEVPVSVTVKNQGDASATTFKVSTEYTSSTGTFVMAFTVPGQANIWYPFTPGNLAAGSSVTFDGKVTFIIGGETVTARAVADSCSGDEFMPAYCRVDESDETNNVSSDVTIVLPAIP
jgi:hypothetical protein